MRPSCTTSQIEAVFQCPGTGAPEDGPDVVRRLATISDLPILSSALPECKFLGYTDLGTGDSYELVSGTRSAEESSSPARWFHLSL
jgi:hypothetical protein